MAAVKAPGSFLSPNDEFADQEKWDKGNLDLSAVKKKEMLEFEYARAAFKNGLKLEEKLGVNPYKFGMVGSSDMMNFLGIAFLSLVTLGCYARLAVTYVRRGDKACAMIVLAEICVLALAASGMISGGH